MQFLFQRMAGGRLGYPVCTACSGLTFSGRPCSVPLEMQPLTDPPEDRQRTLARAGAGAGASARCQCRSAFPNHHNAVLIAVDQIYFRLYATPTSAGTQHKNSTAPCN